MATLVRRALAEVCTVPVLLVVTVSLSSTVYEILSLVCQNVKRSRDPSGVIYHAFTSTREYQAALPTLKCVASPIQKI